MSVRTGQAQSANPDDKVATGPLRARRDRARGELEQAPGNHAAAWESLTTAAQAYRALSDWSNYASVWRILDANG